MTIILKMNNKKKLNLRIEYINHTGIHYLDNLPKYCDYLEAKLIEASNLSDLNDLEELKKYLKFNNG